MRDIIHTVKLVSLDRLIGNGDDIHACMRYVETETESVVMTRRKLTTHQLYFVAIRGLPGSHDSSPVVLFLAPRTSMLRVVFLPSIEKPLISFHCRCLPGSRVVASESAAVMASVATSVASTASFRVTPRGRTTSSRRLRRSFQSQRGALRPAGSGNPFVEGWLDLSETVTGGGKDLGLSELAENLGSDIYMDINGW